VVHQPTGSKVNKDKHSAYISFKLAVMMTFIRHKQ